MNPGVDTPTQCATRWAPVAIALNLADPSNFRGPARQRCAGGEQRNTRSAYSDVDLSGSEAGHTDHKRGDNHRHEKQAGTFGGDRRLPGVCPSDALVVDNRIRHPTWLPESRAEKRRRRRRRPADELARDRFVRPVEWLHGCRDVGCGRGQRVYRIRMRAPAGPPAAQNRCRRDDHLSRRLHALYAATAGCGGGSGGRTVCRYPTGRNAEGGARNSRPGGQRRSRAAPTAVHRSRTAHPRVVLGPAGADSRFGDPAVRYTRIGTVCKRFEIDRRSALSPRSRSGATRAVLLGRGCRAGAG